MRRHLAACAAFLVLAGSPAGAEYQGGYSPAFVAPTPLVTDNTNRIATTEWVNSFIAGGMPLAAGAIFIGNGSNIATANVPSGDWTIGLTGIATLATVNANVGAFGSATQCVTFTTNAKGLTTAASAATCTPAIGSVTGLGTGVATALGVNVGSAGAFVTFNGALGTPSAGTLTNATGLPIGAGTTGTLTETRGGTNQTTYTTGDLLQASGANTLSKLAAVATGNALISGGVGTASSWGKIGLTTHVTGTLAAGNGGTGITALGTGVATALGINVGSAGAFVTFNGALGTPSSGTLTSATGLPISTGVSGLGTGVATFLGTPSSANLLAALTTKTGTGNAVFATAPSLVGTVSLSYTTTGASSAAAFNALALSPVRTFTTGSGDTFHGIDIGFTDGNSGTGVNPLETAALAFTSTYSNSSNTSTQNYGVKSFAQVTANLTRYEAYYAGATLFGGTLGTYIGFHANNPAASGGTVTTKYAFLADANAGSITQNDTTASTSTTTGAIVNAGGMGTAGAGWFGTYVATGAVAVASLPACGAGTKAARMFVTDANATFTAGIGAVVAAGGANNVPVTCDGTNWRIG